MVDGWRGEPDLTWPDLAHSDDEDEALQLMTASSLLFIAHMTRWLRTQGRASAAMTSTGDRWSWRDMGTGYGGGGGGRGGRGGGRIANDVNAMPDCECKWSGMDARFGMQPSAASANTMGFWNHWADLVFF